MRPYGPGVLVYRDWSGRDALSEEQSLDIRDQFEAADDRGLIAGFISQMRKSKKVKKEPKAKV